MTTIAVRDGKVAADTLATSNGSREGEVDKARKVGEWTIAFAGEVRVGAEWLDWLQGVIERKEKFSRAPKELQYGDQDSTISGLAVRGGEIFAWDGIAYPYRLKAPFLAIGSGADYAMGAMAMGADPVQAVKVAMKFDCYTGGRVKTYA